MKKRWLKIIRKPKAVVARYKEKKLLESVTGVIHVGANKGQEAGRYAEHDLNVLWIEPIPAVFDQLIENTKAYKKQVSVQALITDVDHREYEFHVANNNGASSSIYQFKEHEEIWPHVKFTETISLRSITLSSLLKREKIDPGKYQALVMDTQGSELLVLAGSLPLLKRFKFIKTEVADFDAYQGACQIQGMNDFMRKNGFKEYFRKPFGRPTKNGGRYFNIIYLANS
ncbi:FkbM family methyltransferase [Neolewinella agarilytica]|uniref:Methyltransferase, FkbM family n=1 Tax=Neolewinella agarilytica TaxID=478744 RepID=A0A1H9G5G4_9BACT|nr:FkbM family methyltransferase [Neolewinella agarilytica]SEQ45386.1 methyltransferase, FkbM family [Neolewinella agarilytica]